MKNDLSTLEKIVQELPVDDIRREFTQLITETRALDKRMELLRCEEEKKYIKLRRQSFLLAPVFAIGSVGSIWYLCNVLANGSISDRGKTVFRAIEPLAYWLKLFWPMTGAIVLSLGTFYIARFIFSHRSHYSTHPTKRP